MGRDRTAKFHNRFKLALGASMVLGQWGDQSQPPNAGSRLGRATRREMAV